MNSCLYECHVMHARFVPQGHRFVYRIFMCALDLDELDALHRKLRLFSFNRRNLYSFRDGDYFPTHEPQHNGTASATPPASASLKARIVAHLASQGVDLTGGRILLVTLPRVFGYLFNPVSFYFCFDRTGTAVAALSEVTNTFKEMKPYFLGSETFQDGLFSRRVPKHFYVSPFSDVDVAFDFTLRVPDDRLSVQIDDYVGSERTLTSTLAGPRRELTDARLAWYIFKYPLITLKVIGLIHWHAFRLWLKKVPWFAKSARATDQRGLYRPHTSLTSENSPAERAPAPSRPPA
jgi:DUF1365 family protein